MIDEALLSRVDAATSRAGLVLAEPDGAQRSWAELGETLNGEVSVAAGGVTLFQDDGSALELAFDASKVKRDAHGKFALSAAEKAKLEKKVKDYTVKLGEANAGITESKQLIKEAKKGCQYWLDQGDSDAVLEATEKLEAANKELKAWQTKKYLAVNTIKKAELKLAGVTAKDQKDAAAHDSAKEEETGAQPPAPKQSFPSDLDSLKTVKPLGGSTGATLARDPATGDQYVRKTGVGEAQLREEVLADELYRKLGVDVPQSQMYETDAGPVKLAKFEEGAVELGDATAPQKAAAYAQLRANFAADALLANWDVVGMSEDNILVTPDGRALRADNGGSLRYRAQGASKGPAFGDKVGELESLRDPNVNKSTYKAFGSLTDVEVAHQVNALAPKMPEVLKAAYAHDHELGVTLENRFESMEDWAADKLQTAMTAGEATKGGEALGAKEHFKEKSTSQWVSKLSSKETMAISAWTDGQYADIRLAELQEGGHKPGTPDEHYLDRATVLNAALDRAPPHVGEVYRGVGTNPGDNSYSLMTTPGNTFDWNCSASSSTSGAKAKHFGGSGVMFRIQTKTGAALGSLNSSEKEVILRRNRTYRVIAAEKPFDKYGDALHKTIMKSSSYSRHHLIVDLEEV